MPTPQRLGQWQLLHRFLREQSPLPLGPDHGIERAVNALFQFFKQVLACPREISEDGPARPLFEKASKGSKRNGTEISAGDDLRGGPQFFIALF